MKALHAGLLFGTALLLGGSTSVSAQSRVEDDDWWEVDSMEDVYDDDVSSEFSGPGLQAPAVINGVGRLRANGSSVTGGLRARGDLVRIRVSRAVRTRCAARRGVRGGRECHVPKSARTDRRYISGPRWIRARWEGISFARNFRGFRGKKGFGRVNHNALGTDALEYLIGKRAVRRLERHARYLGARGPIVGRILDRGTAGIVVQVRSGRVPIATLRDYDGDRRVDAIHLSYRSGYVW